MEKSGICDFCGSLAYEEDLSKCNVCSYDLCDDDIVEFSASENKIMKLCQTCNYRQEAMEEGKLIRF